MMLSMKGMTIDHWLFRRNAKNGQKERHRALSAFGGDSRVHVGDLLWQDWHVDDQPNVRLSYDDFRLGFGDFRVQCHWFHLRTRRRCAQRWQESRLHQRWKFRFGCVRWRVVILVAVRLSVLNFTLSFPFILPFCLSLCFFLSSLLFLSLHQRYWFCVVAKLFGTQCVRCGWQKRGGVKRGKKGKERRKLLFSVWKWQNSRHLLGSWSLTRLEIFGNFPFNLGGWSPHLHIAVMDHTSW